MESFLFFLVLTFIFQSSKGDAGDDLNKLQVEYGEWRLRRLPEYATRIGNYKYNDLVESYDTEIFTEEKDKCSDILNRLGAIPYLSLTSKQKSDYDIFNDTLQTVIRGYKWRNYNALNPVNFLEGPHISPNRLPERTNFDTLGDYENYLTRLSLIPKQIDEMIERLRKAIKLKHTYHKVSVERVPLQIDELLKDDDPTHFAYYRPFNDSLPQNYRISNTTKLKMVNRAATYIFHIIEKLKVLKSFINDTYIGNTRKGYGVSSWDKGEEFYRDCLRWHLSLDMSPEEVHQKGLSEVARISGEMRTIMKRLNHQGTVKEFFDKVKNNSTFSFKTGEEMLSWYNNAIRITIQSKLSKLFKEQDLPNLPVEVRPNPIDGIMGRYFRGSSDGSRPGVFQVNVFHPTQKTTIDALSLTMHETNPGHHLQNTIELTSKLASYRKNRAGHYYAIPSEAPFYSSYGEGWGLYSEYLGQEMGLYKDDFVMMGKYSWEIFRACRLVVDTGLHYKNWTRERAIEYMQNYTAKGINEINVEIDRYLTWPGQACSYKIGELKIRQLRTKSEDELGIFMKPRNPIYVRKTRKIRSSLHSERLVLWRSKVCEDNWLKYNRLWFSITDVEGCPYCTYMYIHTILPFLERVFRKCMKWIVPWQAFDIKEFHHVILKDGGLPLSVLEKNVNQWIKDTKDTKPTPYAPNHGCRTSNSGSGLIQNLFSSFNIFILAVSFSVQQQHIQFNI